MRRWILPFVLLVVAGFASWQTFETDAALAEPVPVDPDQVTESPLATPLLSVRRTPEWLREPLLVENLEASLTQLATTFPSQSCLVVNIDGEEVFSRNGTLPLVPASAQKVLTAFGVYEILGGDHTFETSVVTDAPLTDGVLDGDLYLVGGGDPLLATQPYTIRYEQQPHFRTAIEDLADAVVAAGITEINGGIVGDEERYDDERYLPQWPERFTNVSQNQTGPLSALTVNDGFVNFAENTAPSLATATLEPAIFAAGFFDDLLEERGVIIRGGSGEGASAGGRADDCLRGVRSRIRRSEPDARHLGQYGCGVAPQRSRLRRLTSWLERRRSDRSGESARGHWFLRCRDRRR